MSRGDAMMDGMPALRDNFGRRFRYLRLSVTEVCNFRCAYCLPNGYQRTGDAAPPLTLDEIERLVRGFAELGTEKVRITGGEPTTRKDVLEIVSRVARVPGVSIVALSTNGYRLRELAAPFARAGLQRLNVSIDSLDRKTFAEVTGHDALNDILAGVDAALAEGLTLKINTVALRDWNEDQIDGFLAWVRDKPLTVRFIELMRTGDNELFFLRRHVPGDRLRGHLRERGWRPLPRGPHDGPAEELFHPHARGKVGLITPYASDFCSTCNRLRVTSTGQLRLCLFADGNQPLRPFLRDDAQRSELQAAVRAALLEKPLAHRLHEGDPGNTRHLAQMGG